MSNDGWEELIPKVMEICNKYDIDMPDMDTLLLDLQLHELNARFDEHLQCVSCLNPSSSFVAFDAKNLLRMIKLYSNDFVDVPEVVVRHQFQNYVISVRCDPKFAKLKELSNLYKWKQISASKIVASPKIWDKANKFGVKGIAEDAIHIEEIQSLEKKGSLPLA
ncbi:hypothetical protein KIW84_045511 [Lathyrus oleraceus]|uniref:Uncharacterized protein n=1 Tax=Pisum sativum TaxID=3888 RepID=A0A9D4XLB8_PEA|nr:hypothetical protein KIW84_045511 [Pisum sativum]